MIILKSKLHSDHLLPTPDLLHLISSNKFAVCYDVSYLINKYIYTNANLSFLHLLLYFIIELLINCQEFRIMLMRLLC